VESSPPVFSMGTDDGPGSWNRDEKKSLQALYLNISDQQLLDAIDMMKFDAGATDIRLRK
jgi:hypothetical protein